jgi:tetratricopeptide (TPR) repeat protein
VLAQNPGPPTAGWAEIGLGWAALARGDLETARAHYAQAPEDGGSAGLAAMMTGMIDAATGDPAAVAGRLEQMVADPATPPRLASMLGLIAGYARYWSGDYEGAAKAFAAVAAADPEGPAADDARFAAARVQAALGDREGARAALREMSDAAKRPGPGGPVGGGLIDLDPRAMLRASVRRYRHSSLSQVLDAVSLLDGDGRVLAGTALRRRTWGNASPPGGPATAHAPSAAPAGARLPAAGTATVRGEARETGAARGESASSHPRRTWLALAAGLVAILLALVLRRRTAA